MTVSTEMTEKELDDVSRLTPQEQLFEWCGRLANPKFSTQGDDETKTSESFYLLQIKRILGVCTQSDSEGVDIERVSGQVDFDVNETNDRGLRPLDVLCRGNNKNTSDEACFAAMYLIQAGTEATEQPSPSEAAPLHICAYDGNWKMMCTLLDIGIDATGVSNGSKQQLLGSTAIHALATGFREARAENYAECFSALLGSGCDVDARDRKRQTALDIAVRTAASTGNKALIDAMFEYGVNIEGESPTGALAVAQALSKRTNDARIMSQLSGSAFGAVARSVEALQALELSKKTSNNAIRP